MNDVSGSQHPSKNPSIAKRRDLIAIQQVNGTIQQILEMPEIRADMVHLGQRLANDPNYPSIEVIEEISRALHRTYFR